MIAEARALNMALQLQWHVEHGATQLNAACASCTLTDHILF